MPDIHWPAVVVTIAALATVCVLYLVGHAPLAAAAGAIGILVGAPMRGVFDPSSKTLGEQMDEQEKKRNGQ